MTPTVCLVADTLGYTVGGGHRWVYLNWALGLRAAGCRVIWIELIPAGLGGAELAEAEAALRDDLARQGLDTSLALYDEQLGELAADAWDADVDLLLNMSYGVPARLLERARRSAMIDIDPGLTQLWIRDGYIQVPEHDLYFSVGEAARRGGLPDCGIEWHYTPPCVDVSAWPVRETEPNAPYTTVTHWWVDPAEGWIELRGEWFENSKRAGFEPYLALPQRTAAALELALGGLDSVEEADRLSSYGWRIRDAWEVAGSTHAYAAYIGSSRGEFSCAKPSGRRLEPGWISDRTLCYLASGKPAVVEHCGDLELPDDRGLLQFGHPDEAVRALAAVQEEYELHSRAARALAEARFDARKVAGELLEKALP